MPHHEGSIQGAKLRCSHDVTDASSDIGWGVAAEGLTALVGHASRRRGSGSIATVRTGDWRVSHCRVGAEADSEDELQDDGDDPKHFCRLRVV